MSTFFKYTLVFCLTILPCLLFAQELSQLSIKVKATWEDLNKTPNSKDKQIDFIRAFPQNKTQFLAVFDQNDFSQLYRDSYKYVNTFAGLSKSYPNEIITKSLNIGKELEWQADAVGFLQHDIVKMAIRNTVIFYKALDKLPEQKATHLIKFLADVENHKAYSEYQQLIDALKTEGKNKLASKFIKARLDRERIEE